MKQATKEIFKKAKKGRLGKQGSVPQNWMPIGKFYPFTQGGPLEIWLEMYGAQHGLSPEKRSPYSYREYLFKQSRAFRKKWQEKYARNAFTICQETYHVRYLQYLKITLEFMEDQIPVIANPALWWSPVKLYGVPDFIVHTSHIKDTFPELFQELEDSGSSNEGYVIFEVKYSTSLKEYQIIQMMLNSYLLGHLQNWMPTRGFVVTRKGIESVEVPYSLNDPLQEEYTQFRDQYLEIKKNGKDWKPGVDDHLQDSVLKKLFSLDERWRPAVKELAWRITPGGDPSMLYQVGKDAKVKLADNGFTSIDKILGSDIQDVPLPNRGIKQSRAILQANRTGQPVLPVEENPPEEKEFEFFVDYEYFTPAYSNIEEDLVNDMLIGREMIFMIGVGWVENNEWNFQYFVAEKDDSDGERKIIDEFMEFLDQKIGGEFSNSDKTALYHWAPVEGSQSKNAAKRLDLPENHPFRKLHWFDEDTKKNYDLRRVFMQQAYALPGAWDFELKSVAKALAAIDPVYDPHWIGDLTDGLRAMMVGIEAYKQKFKSGKNKGKVNLDTSEMKILKDYLEADCKALWSVLRWMREPDKSGLVFGAAEQEYVGWDEVKKPLPKPIGPEQYAKYILTQTDSIKEIPMFRHLIRENGEYKGIDAVQNLIWGDKAEVLEIQDSWRRVRARGEIGWLRADHLSEERLLEVNFVDVGQGDGCLVVTPDNRLILVDAGEKNNMYRFLRWRFSHRQKPVEIEATVITHPDQDHYGGFNQFFEEPSDQQHFKHKQIFHNGIIDRGSKDLGEIDDDSMYLIEIIEDKELLEPLLLDKTKKGRYLDLLRKADEQEVDEINLLCNNPPGPSYMPGFAKNGEDQLYIEVLGPVPEPDENNKKRLRFFDKDAGITKNGHSVILKLVYKNVSMLLGGDLNIPSEKYLLTHYSGLDWPKEDDQEQEQRLAEIATQARVTFKVDIAKACHHGSADFTEVFLNAVDAPAIVVSSGDDESHTHPRPDALGAFGHHNTAHRPLIFSTELARSTKGDDPKNHPLVLQAEYRDAQKEKKEAEFIESIFQRLGRQVAVYGMISIRTDGKKVLIAQKKERKGSGGAFEKFLMCDVGGRLTFKSKH